MSDNLSVTPPDFDNIKKESGIHTADGFRLLWAVANNQGKDIRTGVRLAIERQEVKSLISSPTTNQNNFNTEFSTTLRFDGSTSFNLTGIRARVEGARVRILVLGSGTVTVKHNSASSEAVNRIITETAADISVTTNKALDLEYQSGRWRAIKWA